MRQFTIPLELVEMLTARRVIPFIGAGFSRAHGLPMWDDMLRKVAEDVDSPVPFADVQDACNSDPLQIAEYLLLIAPGKHIGPLRQSLSEQLRLTSSPIASSCHIELVNLGAARIYTTNYDESIERTLRVLGEPVEVIALPQDVAAAHGEATEVVKYHGDLRYEHTLVLTESQYYTRLDFESPMDLKFRSDLLGRSVLFMGYSFRDINIRVIWFKLMRMMKDVPAEDRLASYIVRFEPNEVLEKLYDAVGLKTIVIDPASEVSTQEEQSELLAEFLLSLTMQASENGTRPGSGDMFVSETLLRAIETDVAQAPDPRQALFRPTFLPTSLRSLFVQLANRRVPDELIPRAREVFEALSKSNPPAAHIVPLAKAYLQNLGPGRPATRLIATALVTQPTREAVLRDAKIDWAQVWEGRLTFEDIRFLVSKTESEVGGHETGEYDDEDLAYCIDIAKRIAAGQLAEADLEDDIIESVQSAIHRAAELYPAVAEYEPLADGPPNPHSIVAEIAEAVAARAEDEGADEEYDEDLYR